MKTGSILTILAAIAAVVAAAIIASGGGGKAKPASTTGGAPAVPAGSQQLSFVVSPEKEELLKPLVAKFNAAQTRGRRQARLRDAEGENSGDAEAAIARGRLQPDVWSPASVVLGTAAEPAGRQALRRPTTTRRSCARRS